MTFKRIIICYCFLTLLALCYVYQQTRIVELGYEIKKKEEALSQLLDRNKILVYNVNALCSPLNLDEQVLSKRLDLSQVTSYRIVRLASAKEGMPATAQRPLIGFLFNLFVPKAEAQASTISRSNSD